MTRTEQREQAFYLLFENEFQKSGGALIEIYNENFEPVSDFAKTLYLGVLENIDSIDEIIAKYSKGWKVARLPKVSLCVLRLAIYEMEHIEDIPQGVSINEAVEIAKKFSSKDDASFINGVLGTYSRSDK